MRTIRLILAASVVLVLACRPGTAAQRSYDLVVIGATPGGVACAVRGAREGLQVILVDHLQHLGGLFSSGMVMLDTQYEGRRAPLLHEFSQRVLDDYRTRYGEDSPQYKLARPPPRTTSAERMSFEPHVAEAAIEAMVQAEETLTVLKGYYPQAVERAERLLQSVVLAPYRGDSEAETNSSRRQYLCRRHL